MNHLSKVASVCLSVLAVAAQPALAADKSSSNSTATSIQQPGDNGMQARKVAKEYCIMEMPETASRVAKRVCRTKAEWTAEGVEIKASK